VPVAWGIWVRKWGQRRLEKSGERDVVIRMAKSTKAETQKRIRLVLEMLLQSTPTVDIVGFGMEKWGIGRGALKSTLPKPMLSLRKPKTSRLVTCIG